ncbi:hypothetical protein LZ023_19770 [Pseudomonas silvicola]|nr:hypothetical protein LZ023_19770 [Pseudomonas silvicola]
MDTFFYYCCGSVHKAHESLPAEAALPALLEVTQVSDPGVSGPCGTYQLEDVRGPLRHCGGIACVLGWPVARSRSGARASDVSRHGKLWGAASTAAASWVVVMASVFMIVDAKDPIQNENSKQYKILKMMYR